MNSISSFTQTSLVILDKVCDYFPYYSMYNNGLCLIAKAMLRVIESYSLNTYEKIQNAHLVRHLKQKEIVECILLSIPYLNIFVALARDFSKIRKKTTPPAFQQVYEQIPVHTSTTPPSNCNNRQTRSNTIDEARNLQATFPHLMTEKCLSTIEESEQKIAELKVQIANRNKEQELQKQQRREEVKSRIEDLKQKIAGLPDTEEGRLRKNGLEKLILQHTNYLNENC